MKKIAVRKAGVVRLTASASLYGDPITCPWSL